MMLSYSDEMQKYILQMFKSHRSEFSRLFRLKPGTTWMKSLQKNLGPTGNRTDDSTGGFLPESAWSQRDPRVGTGPLKPKQN